MMSIAFERSTGDRIERPGLCLGISRGSAYDPPEPALFASDRRNTVAEASSSSSSIGRNSDSDSGGGCGESGDGDGEVQSNYKGPLDCLDALEEVLPIKKGMSNFYNGKSKSFTSLADVSSIKEIAKPENALTRKRKNLIAHATFWDKNRHFPPQNSSCSLSKKPTNSDRSTSTYNSNESNNSDTCNSNASQLILSRPPLHPKSKKLLNDEQSSSPTRRNFSSWRSFSLSDLHDATDATPTASLVINKGDQKSH